MKLKQIFAASVLAVAAAGNAFAALTLNAGQERTFDTEFVKKGAFEDVYEFVFGFPGGGQVQGSISELRFGTAKDITFGVGAVQVIGGNGLTLLSLDGTGKTSFFEIVGADDAPLFIGTNSFKVIIKGSADGTGQILGGTSTYGSYDFSIQAAPVPEPETYALMLAGLGAVGFMLRRRVAK